MKQAEGPFLVLALVVLALGIGYASTNVRKGLQEFRNYDRYVTVKGLAQRDVVADTALWPIAYTETGNDLQQLQATMETKGQAILSFLKQHGIEEGEVDLQQVAVQDLLAQAYRQQGAENNRYILTQTYLVRTGKIENVAKGARDVGQLIAQGIVFAQSGGNGPIYLYTKLNDIKPSMIAEATQNARDAAAQFAKDSGTNVGGIRSAYQGIFQILPRDETYTIPEPQQINKTVRVVSTVDFYLE